MAFYYNGPKMKHSENARMNYKFYYWNTHYEPYYCRMKYMNSIFVLMKNDLVLQV